MNLEAELEYELIKRGATFVSFADISQLAQKPGRSYPRAILIGMSLSPEYIQRFSRDNETKKDHFYETEGKTDQLADYLSGYLSSKGYAAYPQSEYSLLSTDNYDENTKTSPLPHKTIARLSGLGWIGKHNLFISKEFGSAISMCTVLTDAPIKTKIAAPVSSECGSCTVCEDICPVRAIKGNTWQVDTPRDEMVDVYICSSCLKCLVLCPHTQDYAKNSMDK